MDPVTRTIDGLGLTKAPGLIALPEGTPPLRARALRVLQESYGYESFREGQPEVIDAVLKGRDVLTVFPTSWGKSVCFQVPTIMRWEESGQATLVISPLMALIRDQVHKLNQLQIPCAHFLSDQTPQERLAQCKEVLNGNAAFIYITPERLLSSSFQALLKRARKSGKLKLGMVVVDEAHLIEEWGHDFRWAYGVKLGQVIDTLPRPQVFACSATVTESTRLDIRKVLNLKDAFEHTGPLDRPNLNYHVFPFDDDRQKQAVLLKELKQPGCRLNHQPPADGLTVIYVATRSAASDLAEFLRNHHLPARPYHGGMEPEERQANERLFRDGICRYLIATKAYGMGIDISEIRRIIHFHTPGSLTQYHQEAGRAGRDGRKASVELWFSPLDVYQQLYFIRQQSISRERLKNRFHSLYKGKPRRFINLADYLDRDGPHGHLVSARQADLTALIEYGLIDIQGWNILFGVKPEQVEARLPSEQECRTARAKRYQLLDEIIYYGANEPRPGESRASIIYEKFLHNTLIDRISASHPRRSLSIPRERLAKVVAVVDEQDYSLQHLVKTLHDARPDRGLGRFPRLSRRETEALVSHACYTGLLRLHGRGCHSYVSVARRGVELLDELFPPEAAERFKASATFVGLLKRLGHYSERETLRQAIDPWFQGIKARLQSEPDLLTALSAFDTARFKILDGFIRGGELVARYYKVRADLVSNQQRRNFLAYLFGRSVFPKRA